MRRSAIGGRHGEAGWHGGLVRRGRDTQHGEIGRRAHTCRRECLARCFESSCLSGSSRRSRSSPSRSRRLRLVFAVFPCLPSGPACPCPRRRRRCCQRLLCLLCQQCLLCQPYLMRSADMVGMGTEKAQKGADCGKAVHNVCARARFSLSLLRPLRHFGCLRCQSLRHARRGNGRSGHCCHRGFRQTPL